MAVLIRVLKKTKDFEEQLVRKFSVLDGNEIEMDNFAISVVTDETGKAKVEYNVGTAQEIMARYAGTGQAKKEEEKKEELKAA